MECIIGLVGGDYAMIAADMNAGRSIMVFNQEADRIMEMDSHKLLGVCGDPADCVNEPQFFQKNLNLYALRNAEKQLSTHATANYMRGEKSANLRRGMKDVDMLLAGFDEGVGPSLYFIDYLASMQKLDLGLTFKEIKFVMVEFAFSHPDGLLEYSHFVDEVFDVCLDMVAGKLLDGGETFNEVQETFMRLFSEADKDGGGMLSCSQLSRT